jgi:WD40 repeat protein
VSLAFPFDPAETLFWQATADPPVASKLARYRGPATTFSPDGALGIGFASEGGPPNYGYRLNGFELDANRALWTRLIPGGAPPTATFSPDGRWVSIASRTNSWVLDARTGAQVAELSEANIGGAVAFSRDSRRMAMVRRNEARVFDVSDWRSIAEMRFPDGQVLRGVTFTPDGRRVVVAGGGHIHVWDAINSREVRRISMAAARPVQALAVSPRGRWLAAGTARTPPRLWTRNEGPSTVVAWPLDDDDSPRSMWTEDDVSILALAFSPDERRLGRVSFGELGSRAGPQFDGDISVVTLATSAQQVLSIGGEEIRRGNYDVIPGAAAKDLAFTSDGSTIVAAMLGMRAYRPAVQDFAEYEPFPQLVLYDARTLQPRRVVDVDGSDFAALAASSDGTLLATGHDANTVRVWTAATARQRAVFRWPVVDRRDVLGSGLGGGSITSLAFHPDGRRLAVARDDGVAVVDVGRRTRQEIAAAKDQGYSAIAFSPDGSSLLYASGTVQGEGFVDARISQWVTATRRPGWTLDLGTTEVPRLAFAPNGRWFAAATSGGVSIHDAVTGVHLATLAMLATDDWLAWTPDGRYAGSPAGIARLGAIRQGRRALPLGTVGRQLELREFIKQVLP